MPGGDKATSTANFDDGTFPSAVNRVTFLPSEFVFPGMNVMALAFLACFSHGVGQRHQGLAVGDAAPAVVAELLDGKGKFDLATNKGKRLTVLIFGSCT